MNIDDRLMDILSNNCIFKERRLKNDKIKNILKKELSNIPKGTNVAFRGGGEHTEELIKYIPDDINVTCYIDRDKYYLTYNDIKIISMQEINDYQIDIFIISSYQYRKEMLLELKKFNKQIIDIYELLEENGIFLDGCFYKYDDSFIDYEQIVDLKSKYNLEHDDSIKQLYLEEIIIDCIIIKDFISAQNYIKLYIENNYTKTEEYTKLYHDIDMLMNEIKNAFSNRKHKDIVMFWIDELSYHEIYDMPFLCSLIADSMFFTKAYTTTVNTKGVIKSIFQKKMSIDDYTNENAKFNNDNSIMLNTINKNGYKFKFISHAIHGAHLFEDEFCINENDIKRFTCSCKKLWILLKLLLESSEPVFAIVHILKEAHIPFHSTDLELGQLRRWDSADYLINGKDDYIDQINISRRFIDRQIEFYSNLMNYNCTKIYMSDHGKRADISKPMNESKVHTLLMVDDKNIKHSKVNNIFSSINYLELIEYILNSNNDSFNKMFNKEYVLYQELDTYDASRIQSFIEADQIFPGAFALRGIITENDRYVRTGYGEEFYYISEDENINLIHHTGYDERINELRKIAGSHFLDIYQYDRFKDSILLYEKYGLKNQGTN